MITTFTLLIGLMAPGASATPIVLGANHELFLDDYLIASMENVTRRVCPARKHPANPLLWPEEPWEGSVALIYGSITRDDGKYRMWYLSGIGVSYAESDDGIAWHKPEEESN